MKKTVNFTLLLVSLLVLVLAIFLTASFCSFQRHPFGVEAGSVAEQFLKGNTKKGFRGYSLDSKKYETAEEATAALLNGTVEFLLYGQEDAEQIATDSRFKTVSYALTGAEHDSLTIVTLKSNTAYDGCASKEDVLQVLDSMQKTDFQVEWDLFYNKFITHKGYEVAIDGLLATLQIAVLGLLIGILIGTPIAVIKMIPKYKVAPRVLSAVCDVYVGFFRGTPMVVQLLIGWFILLPALNLQLDNVMVATIVFGMNSGAYVSEIMRSGIQAVDRGQLEAARAVGLGYWTSMLKIVIPQGIKNILPTLGNEFIILVKDTSIVSFIAVVDITKAFRQIGDANYSYMIPYLMLAAIYLIIVMGITLLIKWMERRLAKSERSGK